MRRDDRTTHPHPYPLNKFIIAVFLAFAKHFENICSFYLQKRTAAKYSSLRFFRNFQQNSIISPAGLTTPGPKNVVKLTSSVDLPLIEQNEVTLGYFLAPHRPNIKDLPSQAGPRGNLTPGP
jgi:hypothetical protein